MNRIERYDLIEELHTSEAVTVWRARDTLQGGAEVTIEVIAVSDANQEAMRGLRTRAHERSGREKHTTVRIFEDLERGLLGVATQRSAGHSRTKVDPPAPPMPASSAEDVPTRQMSATPFIVGALILVAGVIGIALWVSRSPSGSETDATIRLPSAKPSSTSPTPSSAPSPSHEPMTNDPPSETEWKTAPEVAVYGSSGVHCRTFRLRNWFRADCSPEPDGLPVAPVSMEWVRGARPVEAHVSGPILVTPLGASAQHIRFYWHSPAGHFEWERELTLFPSDDPRYETGEFSLECTGPSARGWCCLSSHGAVGTQSTACSIAAGDQVVCRADIDCSSLPAGKQSCKSLGPDKDPHIKVCQ